MNRCWSGLRAAALAMLVAATGLPGSALAAQDSGAENYNCRALNDAGEHLKAANCFASLEAAGNHNGHLLYNLGNAWQQAATGGNKRQQTATGGNKQHCLRTHVASQTRCTQRRRY